MNFDAFVFELRTALNALQRTVDEVTEKLAQRVDAPTAEIASTLLFDGDRLTANDMVRLQTGQVTQLFYIASIFYMRFLHVEFGHFPGNCNKVVLRCKISYYFQNSKHRKNFKRGGGSALNYARGKNSGEMTFLIYST